MKFILIILLSLNFASYGQPVRKKNIPPGELFEHTIGRYIEFITLFGPGAIDTLFIQLEDAMQFHLPATFDSTVIVGLPVNDMIVRLGNKPGAYFIRIDTNNTRNNQTEILIFKRTIHFPDNEPEIVEDIVHWSVMYSVTKEKLYRYRSIVQSTTGCRRFYKIRGNIITYHSICI